MIQYIDNVKVIFREGFHDFILFYEKLNRARTDELHIWIIILWWKIF